MRGARKFSAGGRADSPLSVEPCPSLFVRNDKVYLVPRLIGQAKGQGSRLIQN